MPNRVYLNERRSKDPASRLKKHSFTDAKTGCWIWEGSNTGHSGYGYISYMGRMVSVHRLSAHLFLSFDLTSPLFVLHKLECPNKDCWNPEHLYVGTRSQNAIDAEKKKRSI